MMACADHCSSILIHQSGVKRISIGFVLLSTDVSLTQNQRSDNRQANLFLLGLAS